MMKSTFLSRFFEPILTENAKNLGTSTVTSVRSESADTDFSPASSSSLGTQTITRASGEEADSDPGGREDLWLAELI